MSQHEVEGITGIRQNQIRIQPTREVQPVTVAETPKQAPNPTLSPATPEDPKVEELRETLDTLKKLKSRGYKDQHPDVKRLSLLLERLEKDMTPEQIARAKEPLPPAADDANYRRP